MKTYAPGPAGTKYWPVKRRAAKHNTQARGDFKTTWMEQAPTGDRQAGMKSRLVYDMEHNKMWRRYTLRE